MPRTAKLSDWDQRLEQRKRCTIALMLLQAWIELDEQFAHNTPQDAYDERYKRIQAEARLLLA
jgi:hypothetical protein